jgi:dihydrofolate reductase
LFGFTLNTNGFKNLSGLRILLRDECTKCFVYIAASLDGFIAKPDGDIEWLHNPEYGPMVEGGLSYGQFISGIDAIVMGRNTFDKVLEFDPWPYEGTTVVVLTNRPIDMSPVNRRIK